MKLIDHDWVDSKGNCWSITWYTEKVAKRYSKTMVNCKDCRNCSNCVGCTECVNCHECENCTGCYHLNWSENCHNIIVGSGLKNQRGKM